MKITLRLVCFLVGIVALVAFVFSSWQVRQEEDRLKGELEKRAGVIADTLKIAVEPLLSADNTKALQSTVDRFSDRERLVGIAIHDVRENLIVASRERGIIRVCRCDPGGQRGCVRPVDLL
ncbi:MAG: hypothetical protein HYZ86_00440 [Candidatus Omnitrophica bacterium]|nr:hypothetical protein [Candidatus Omnitrophota bacterium]